MWPELPHDRLTRVEAMEIYGDDGAARLDFSAYDAGLRELAVIVENRLLQQALWRAAQAAVARVYCPADCASLHLGTDGALLSLADGAELGVRLVVGADGADSWVRTQAGIAVVPVDYGQLGVVANFSREVASRDRVPMVPARWRARAASSSRRPGLHGVVDRARERRAVARASGP